MHIKLRKNSQNCPGLLYSSCIFNVRIDFYVQLNTLYVLNIISHDWHHHISLASCCFTMRKHPRDTTNYLIWDAGIPAYAHNLIEVSPHRREMAACKTNMYTTVRCGDQESTEKVYVPSISILFTLITFTCWCVSL